MKHILKFFCSPVTLLGALSCTAQATEAVGQQLYAHNCLACHQADGLGIPGAFPALKASPLVLGNETSLLRVVLAGRGGMPTFNGSLDDNQIAAVVTYIRSEWGNRASRVNPAQVAQVSASITAVADEGGRGN